jgi:hypothetical protein
MRIVCAESGAEPVKEDGISHHRRRQAIRLAGGHRTRPHNGSIGTQECTFDQLELNFCDSFSIPSLSSSLHNLVQLATQSVHDLLSHLHTISLPISISIQIVKEDLDKSSACFKFLRRSLQTWYESGNLAEVIVKVHMKQQV